MKMLKHTEKHYVFQLEDKEQEFFNKKLGDKNSAFVKGEELAKIFGVKFNPDVEISFNKKDNQLLITKSKEAIEALNSVFSQEGMSKAMIEVYELNPEVKSNDPQFQNLCNLLGSPFKRAAIDNVSDQEIINGFQKPVGPAFPGFYFRLPQTLKERDDHFTVYLYHNGDKVPYIFIQLGKSKIKYEKDKQGKILYFQDISSGEFHPKVSTIAELLTQLTKRFHGEIHLLTEKGESFGTVKDILPTLKVEKSDDRKAEPPKFGS